MNQRINNVRLRWMAAALLGIAAVAAGAVHARDITDISGRRVQVPDRVQRVLLGEGRLIYSMAILEGRQAFDRVVGWQGDLRHLDVQGYARMRETFPQADAVPVVGGTSPETFSVEKALAVRPEVVFLSTSGGHGPGPGSEAVKRLESAGIAVVFVDFSQHPLRQTVPSLRVMGEVLGRRDQADAYASFYDAQIRRVTDRLSQAARQGTLKRPTVFVDMLAGLRDCCGSPGSGSFGDMIELAGGENIGQGRIPGPIGSLSLEYILTRNPDVYVATGVFAAGQGGVTLGYQATAEQARRSLEEVAQRAGIRELQAVREGRVFGLWHIFYDSPEHLLAVQTLAKWLHPQLFADLDPVVTRAELYRRFMPIPVAGTLMTEAGR